MIWQNLATDAATQKDTKSGKFYRPQPIKRGKKIRIYNLRFNLYPIFQRSPIEKDYIFQ